MPCSWHARFCCCCHDSTCLLNLLGTKPDVGTLSIGNTCCSVLSAGLLTVLHNAHGPAGHLGSGAGPVPARPAPRAPPPAAAGLSTGPDPDMAAAMSGLVMCDSAGGQAGSSESSSSSRSQCAAATTGNVGTAPKGSIFGGQQVRTSRLSEVYTGASQAALWADNKQEVAHVLPLLDQTLTQQQSTQGGDGLTPARQR
jgi:hypothetical protein